MLNRIHHRLGTAGFVIAIIALVAALGGGAYAASGGLSGKQKKEVEKIAKKYAGKNGATGAAGPAGAPGPAGAAGAKGDKGDVGTNGTNGSNGTNGTSVTNTAVPTSSATCNHLGGAEFKVGAGGATTACNGQSGFTDHLPSGKTETGTWNVTLYGIQITSGGEFGTPTIQGSISFPIPLETGGNAFVFTEEQTEEEEFGASGCGGTAIEPTAPAGVLCIYTYDEGRAHTTGNLSTITTSGQGFAYGPSGTLLHGLQFQGTEAAPARATIGGSWAVTAP